jgi:hypothetical protein
MDQTQQEKVFLAFDLYLDEICGGLAEARANLTEEQVLDVVFRCADKLAEKGHLPPFPEKDDAKAMGEWLSAADRVGFHRLVDRLAEALDG